MFENREEAGDLLLAKLKKIIKGNNGDFIVLALLRGGIVLGKRISDYFNIPLMPLAIRKIGAPFNKELAIGAVTSNKTYFFDKKLIKRFSIEKDYLDNALKNKWKESEDFQKKFPTSPRLRGAGKISLKDKEVIVVDDGVATGSTAICASLYAKKEKTKKIILATPLIPTESIVRIGKHFDSIVFLQATNDFASVSEFYRNFPQVEDEDVIKLL